MGKEKKKQEADNSKKEYQYKSKYEYPSGCITTGFVKVNAALEMDIAHDCGPSGYLVYSRILRHKNYKDSFAFPSISTIANECSLGVKTVSRCIDSLEKNGYLKVKSGKQGVNNTYYFPNTEFFDEAEYAVSAGSKRYGTFADKNKKGKKDGNNSESDCNINDDRSSSSNNSVFNSFEEIDDRNYTYNDGFDSGRDIGNFDEEEINAEIKQEDSKENCETEERKFGTESGEKFEIGDGSESGEDGSNFKEDEFDW